MARTRFKAQAIDDTDTMDQGDGETIIAPNLAAKVGRRRKDVPMGRITLSMERALIIKLGIAALSKGVDKCKIVEDAIRPIVSPYVVSIRNTRELSENEAVA